MLNGDVHVRVGAEKETVPPPQKIVWRSSLVAYTEESIAVTMDTKVS